VLSEDAPCVAGPVTPAVAGTSTAAPSTLVVVECAVSDVVAGDTQQSVRWTAVVRNTDVQHIARQPVLRVLAFDGAGQQVGSDTYALPDLPPGATIAASQPVRVTLPVRRVSIDVVPSRWDAASAAADAYLSLRVVNVTQTTVARTVTAIGGEVINPSPVGVDSVLVTILVRDPDGTLDGGFQSIVGPLPANGSLTFGVETGSGTFHSRHPIEVLATPWRGSEWPRLP
jgi:hypothetical protein